MKKILAMVLLALVVSAPSFASDAVTHSAKVVGKDSAKAAAYTTKEVGKGSVAFVKVLF